MKNFLTAAATALCLVLATNALAAINTLDLTTGTGVVTGTASIGGTFGAVWANSQSTGTGVIDPFVRIQANGEERGYNTDNGSPLNTKAGSFTHSLVLGDISQVVLGGTAYRAFLLDINEVNSQGQNLLSLNQIQFFVTPNGVGDDLLHTSLAEATVNSPSLIGFGGATEVFRMSSNDANFNEILLDYNRNPGSGAGDMFLLVNSSLFGANATQNVIMYSHFGDPPGGSTLGSSDDSSDGIEEWATFHGDVPGTTPFDIEPPAVPEPMSLAIWGTLSLAGMVYNRKRLLAKTC